MKRKKTVAAAFFIFTCLFPFYSLRCDSPNDLSHVKGTLDEGVNIEYPAYYDLRELGRVTPVKRLEYQGPSEYGVYAAIESFLTPGEYRSFYERNLRELHMEGFDHYGRRPAILQMNVARLAAWMAPLDHPETGYTYESAGNWDTVQKHIQQVIFLPQREGPLDNNTVKWFIMNHGAVYAQMYAFFTLFYDPVNGSYHQFGHFGGDDEWPNSSPAIVGWDDHFSRDSFREPPPGDGAFIAKFYYGPNFGDQGYLYISYYDSELLPKASFNNAETIANYGDIYQYDPLGATSSVGNGTPVYWGANVFSAREDTALEAVSFYTNDAYTNCDIYIYKNLYDGSPISGGPTAAKTAGFIYPGYYTVKLDAPVPLARGETFSVVIRFINSRHLSPVSIEAPIPDYSSGAEAQTGESYISGDGHSWQDLTQTHPGSNVCIKAFTQYIPTVPTPVVNLEASLVEYNVWLISRTYGFVTFRIENLNQVQVRNIVLYRKTNDGPYEQRRNFNPRDLENGSYNYIEHHIEPGSTYTYHAAVYTEDPRVTGKSNEESLKLD